MNKETKTAIITGSSSGVGAASCIEFAKRGWNVVINYSQNESGAYELAEICKNLGVATLVCQANVANEEDCQRMVDETIKTLGSIDALVNNAGTTRYCNYNDLEGLNKKDFQDIYEVNVIGAYQMVKMAAPYLKKVHGAIVNISSISAISGVGSSIAYAASKGALSTMTLSLAHALAPEVRVNGVCPGFIQTRWTKGFLGDRYESVKENVEKASLINKTSLPEDIAKGIIYLAIDAVTTSGQLLTIDGGQLVNQGKM
ncbi:3-oxoacyl-(acyl-carrier-protein) reductase FabG [Mariniflexile rhizosphaerae]|uniref:SDR family NAD(P)-dependent oxidoreductase n=1 Tax=unclassified Mariniflexile TaxID=2643887 RepID=UPI000CB3BCBE|nr:SDR family oxidoreductase [Mariniflexile sp. TRM1-10]AXP82517.1 3-oxoacyl-(acyl-carrier-protein) reductase FabG [Mariniflexile sp. TRM1-10]PLB19517.1 MAG: Short-chain dehydrogenase [Flavobacteriaceae bacterium FS1-H7996/R]